MRDTAFLQQAERFIKTDVEWVQDHFLGQLAPLFPSP